MKLTVDDRVEILDLYGRYCHYFDGGKAEQWSALFTASGTFTRPGNAETGIQTIDVRGTANLVAFAQQSYKASNGGRRHLVSNIALDATDAGATGMAYLTLLALAGKEPPKVATLGRYQDELIKTSEGWRFQRRVLVTDF